MVEFVSLCVCSACLSCMCCLITGGLCIMPAAVRLRNRIVEKRLPEDMQWLGDQPLSDVCGSDTSSSTDRCPVSRVHPKDRKSICKNSDEISRCSSRERSAAADVERNKFPRSQSRSKKTASTKSRDRSSPRRWTFCLNLGKSARDSSEYCVPAEDAENVPEETLEPKSSRDKKSKKSRSGKTDSKTCFVYFKSCSCTDVREPSKKRYRKKSKRPSEPSSARCTSECRKAKRESKISRKSRKCPKNCQCKIPTENETSVCYSEREVEKKCKCCAKKPFATRRCSK